MGFWLFGKESRQMKHLPLAAVAVMLVVTVTMGLGVAPLSATTTSGEHAEAEAFESQSVTPSTHSPQPTHAIEANSGDDAVLNTLALPTETIERSDLRHQYADLGPASEFDTGVTTDRLVTRSIVAELDAADSDDERLDRIDSELSELETAVIDLEDRQQEAIDAFNQETLEPREFVEELAVIHLKAATYRERMNTLEEYAETIDGDALSDDRLQRTEYDLRMLESPLRAHAVSVLRGEQPANKIMIETSSDELALTAIEDETYIREVNRQGLRESGTPTLSADQPEEMTQEQYPVLWDRSTSWSSDGIDSVFMMSVNYPGGELRTFIDGVSEQTFIEHKQLPLDGVNTGETTNKLQDGLNVTVDQTYAGGPFRVTVTDAETDEPVEATVTVGQDGRESQPVGTVDEDGIVWAISPREPFTVTVLGDGTSAAFVDVTPQPPEAVTAGQ